MLRGEEEREGGGITFLSELKFHIINSDDAKPIA